MLDPSISPAPAAPTRIPPEVLFVPPPPSNVNVGLVLFFIAAGSVLIGAILYTVIPVPRVGLIAGGVVAGQGVLLAALAPILARSIRRQRETYRKAMGRFPLGLARNARIAEFAQTLRKRKLLGLARRVAQLNQSLPQPATPRARIVCIGSLTLPRPGHYLFEPEIITPTRYFGRQWIVMAIGGLLLMLVLVRLLGVFPWLNRMPLGSLGGFGYFYVMFLLIGGLWLWRVVIHPTYIRIAPGMIQTLRYGFRGGKPRVTSFPMDLGTIVVAFGGPSPRRITQPSVIIVARGEQGEMIPVAQMGLGAEMIERLWQAILSTAPPTPLSEEELVG